VTARGRPKHQIETAELKLTTTKVVLDGLKRLVASGYFGKSPNEAAEQIIRQKLVEMLGDQEVSRLLKSSKPPLP
jgi:hypothetical protein